MKQRLSDDNESKDTEVESVHKDTHRIKVPSTILAASASADDSIELQGRKTITAYDEGEGVLKEPDVNESPQKGNNGVRQRRSREGDFGK